MIKKSLILTLTICTAFGAFISGPAYAQLNEFKLTASDASVADRFGNSVSISGDYAIIGAREDDDGGERSGSAYLFVRDGETWTEHAKLTASDATTDDFFGGSVSISGAYAIVGAYSGGPGSAYLFVRDGQSWTEQAKITASDAAEGDWFGLSVSISGNYAIVGAFMDDDGGDRSGSAYLFVRDGQNWTEQAKLTASDAAASDEFGFSVSISGDYAIVGSIFDDDDGERSGSAYVYVRDGQNWPEQAILTANDAAGGDWFGSSVSIDGNYAIVGAIFDDDGGTDVGSAYLFVRDGQNWTEQAKLTASDAAADDFFGGSVSISGDYAILGARENDAGASNSGSAYVYSGIIVGIDDERAGLPTEYMLSQNFPNPFNPITTIEYSLPSRSEVSLIIFNLRGQEIARLVNEEKPAGAHTVRWNASNVASGIYFYRLQAGPQAGGFVQTRKMVLLK